VGFAVDPTEAALLAAICADPADNTARLVFADFLQECGGSVETAWATFIRAHVRLVTDTETAGDIPTVCEYGNIEWLKQFAQRLGFSDAQHVNFDGWERGFPSCLSGQYLEVRREWPALWDRLPFRGLSVSGVDDEAIEDLVLWPHLEQLTTLTLSTLYDGWMSRTVSARGIVALTTCKALAGLEELKLSALEVTDRVADLFLESRILSGLRHLSLESSWATHRMPSQCAVDRLRARFGRNVFTTRHRL
jgi:uncharacterized protein (TIGR02996 family)